MAERLAALSLSEASSLLAAGEVTSRALVQACLQRISHTRELNCYVTETAEEAALEAADASDARRTAGAALGALDGVPLAIKDNLCTQGMRTTCASRDGARSARLRARDLRRMRCAQRGRGGCG